ncbi:hypothetical protein [Actinokineospora sp. NPDC004072]
MDDRVEFAVPAVREVPDEVRDRVAARVLAIPQERKGRGLAVLGAAAAAAGLLVGAVGMWGGGDQGGEVIGAAGQGGAPMRALGISPEAPLDASRAAASLDRCWAAATGLGASVPPRDEWSAVFQVTNELVTVTAVRAAGTPLVCELTAAAVSLSDPALTPAYVEGSRTAALLTTPNGTVAGLLDATWAGARVATTAPSRDRYEAEVVHKDGIFAFLSPIAPDKVAATTIRPNGGGAERVLPKAGAPLVDAGPSMDRSSERERLLRACIEQAKDHRAVPDAASWTPGATAAGADGSRVVIATHGNGVGACFRQGERADFIALAALPPAGGAGVKVAPIVPVVGGQRLIAGTTSREAVRMEVELPDGDVVEADAANGTFALLLPAAADVTSLVCRVYAADGSTIYQGPLR